MHEKIIFMKPFFFQIQYVNISQYEDLGINCILVVMVVQLAKYLNGFFEN